ncbi:chorismate mutase [Brevundimonas sp.]|uniref:chorismate mutase n=1 Tax=Brevundimonas sp. TaxID=1871086 RepID=UPI002EDA0C45
MSQSASLQQVWPSSMTNPADLSPEHMALAALRHEIDLLDDELLALFERRLAIAARVGKAKDAPAGPHVKLRPDREKMVLDRLVAAADPENREAVESLWRQIVGWGLARQGRMQVQVWSPIEPTRAFDGARLRFGAAADMRAVRDPQAALKWAAEGHGVAVLAINTEDAWWTGLRREWTGLSVFDGFGGDIPTALAVGKIDPAALPNGRRVIVDVGGDAGDGGGIRRQGLATHHGWTLSLTDAPLSVGGAEGCVGAVG